MAGVIKLCFMADWLDPSSGVMWRYQFLYYPESKEVEMVRAPTTNICIPATRPPAGARYSRLRS